MRFYEMAKPRIELTERQINDVGALAQYLSKGQIADYLGISRPTFDAILERDERVSLQYKKGRSLAIANVAKGLVQKAMDGNITAAIFYLKTQAGWVEQSEEKETHEVMPVEINIGVVDARKR